MIVEGEGMRGGNRWLTRGRGMKMEKEKEEDELGWSSS